jgi:hypothetical protein
VAVAQTETEQLTRFLTELEPAEWTAYADQLHDIICDELVDAPEPEHLLGHAQVEFLTGERRLAPMSVGMNALRAKSIRELVEHKALMLQAAFKPSAWPVTPAEICDAVIAKARRSGRVFYG